jgi:hypothetical protein
VPVRISDLTVIAGEARPVQIAEMIAWARDRRYATPIIWPASSVNGGAGLGP